jgi:hypothetical protein
MSNGKTSPGTMPSGSLVDFLCAPLMAAPATCVTCPSDATSEIRTTQLARVASAETFNFAEDRDNPNTFNFMPHCFRHELTGHPSSVRVKRRLKA